MQVISVRRRPNRSVTGPISAAPMPTPTRPIVDAVVSDASVKPRSPDLLSVGITAPITTRSKPSSATASQHRTTGQRPPAGGVRRAVVAGLGGDGHGGTLPEWCAHTVTATETALTLGLPLTGSGDRWVTSVTRSAAGHARIAPVSTSVETSDVIVVGAGLAGLAAAAEVADAGKSVLLLDQEPEQSLGGQAFWSLGGLFFVDSPEQRRMGIKDSRDLAMQDWLGSAQFDREEDRWPRRWAEAYVDFAAGEKRAWLREMGHRTFPIVGWAERGDGRADGHGNSVPRFHITWGTGPGVVDPFERRVREHAATGRLRFGFRHQVDDLLIEDGAVVGVRGTLLEPSAIERGKASSRVARRRVRAPRAGRDRHQRRHRRQPRPGPQDLAEAARHAAEDDGRRRPRPRGRPDARHHRGGRRARDQPGPDVALRRGHPQLGPDLGQPRHPDPARARRRCGSTRPASGCPRRTSRASTPSARSTTCGRRATTTRGSC